MNQQQVPVSTVEVKLINEIVQNKRVVWRKRTALKIFQSFASVKLSFFAVVFIDGYVSIVCGCVEL